MGLFGVVWYPIERLVRKLKKPIDAGEDSPVSDQAGHSSRKRLLQGRRTSWYYARIMKTDMRRFRVVPPHLRGYMVAILAWAALALSASADITYVPGTDSRFQLLGTWYPWSTGHYSIYPGSSIRIKFQGTVWVDLADYTFDAPRVRVRLLGQNGGTVYNVNQVLQLSAVNGPAEYEIVFMAIQGVAFSPGQSRYSGTSLYFKGIWLDDGATLYHASPPDGSLRVEFLGDSITHGVRILRDYGLNLDSQDATQCFAYYLARALHAPYRIRGHSGESTRTLDDKIPYFSEGKALIPTPVPDYVFINTGANDLNMSSSYYQSELEQVIWRARLQFPGATIYVLDFFNQALNRVPQIQAAIARQAPGIAFYFNANQYIRAMRDGIHPDAASNWDLARALASLIGPGPSVVSPSAGVIASKRPEFTWLQIPEADSYHLYIEREGTVHQEETVGNVSNWLTTVDMPSGPYRWWVQARNPYAQLGWSSQGDYRILPYLPTEEPTGLLPAGTVPSGRYPTLSWSPVDRATYYYVWVQRNGTTFASQWVEGGVEAVLEDALPWGAYRWWVRAWNADGYGPWSDVGEFDVPHGLPDASLPLSPTGMHEGQDVTYAWNGDADATWYNLWISREGLTWQSRWVFTGASTGLVTEMVQNHAFGHYTWWIRGWGPDGYGPWSSAGDFTYGLASLLRPTGRLATGESQLFSWTGSSDIPWYHLWVTRDDLRYTDLWVQTTNHAFAARLPYGDYRWWVQAFKNNQSGAWSDAAAFQVGVSVPVAPVGDLLTPPAALRWDDSASSDATYYHIYASWAGNSFLDRWVKRADTVSGPGLTREFSGLPTFLPPFGAYTWWIRAYNGTGISPWSEAMTFVVP